MKIAIDISQIVYEGTGIASYTDQLVRNLLSVDRENEYILFGISGRKYQVLSKYFTEIKKTYKNAECKFLPIPQTIGKVLWNRLHIIDLDKIIGKVDIFHSSDWIQPPIAAKKITTIHDLVIYKYPEISHPEIVATQKRRLYWVKKECDQILSDSFATKKDIVNILHISTERIAVVYPGIEEIYKNQNEEEIIRIRQKYRIGNDYILFVGTNEPRKNLHRVISAYKLFLKHPLINALRRPIELVLVGKYGWGRQLKLTNSVHSLDYVDKKDLPAIYSGAIFFIYPSLYEGFGLPVIEAMACGTPVITSNRGSLKEVAGSASLLVDPEMEDDIAVKMTKIMVDKELRTELIKRGKEQVEKFNWGKAAREIKDIYEKVAKQ
jgi:glycosyltransferase involved in cell wall biosynthesis